MGVAAGAIAGKPAPTGECISNGEAGRQPTLIYLTLRDQIVGAGLPAMAASQPTLIYLTPHDQPVGAGLLGEGPDVSSQLCQLFIVFPGPVHRE